MDKNTYLRAGYYVPFHATVTDFHRINYRPLWFALADKIIKPWSRAWQPDAFYLADNAATEWNLTYAVPVPDKFHHALSLYDETHKLNTDDNVFLIKKYLLKSVNLN